MADSLLGNLQITFLKCDHYDQRNDPTKSQKPTKQKHIFNKCNVLVIGATLPTVTTQVFQ